MLTSILETIRRALFANRHGTQDRSPLQGLIFKLKAWPQLPEAGRTAETYRMLSVMSSQAVNRQWLLARFGMTPQQLDLLLTQLMQQDALEVIDPARFAGREAVEA